MIATEIDGGHLARATWIALPALVLMGCDSPVQDGDLVRLDDGFLFFMSVGICAFSVLTLPAEIARRRRLGRKPIGGFVWVMLAVFAATLISALGSYDRSIVVSRTYVTINDGLLPVFGRIAEPRSEGFPVAEAVACTEVCEHQRMSPTSFRDFCSVEIRLTGDRSVKIRDDLVTHRGDAEALCAGVKRWGALGDRILDDREFFAEDLAKGVRDAPPGQGRFVRGPAPEIARLEEKYGQAAEVAVKSVPIWDGPTIMWELHVYGDLGLAVANGRVVAVVKSPGR